MKHDVRTRIPAHIVPHYAQSKNAVKVEIPKIKVSGVLVILIGHIALAMLIAHRSLQGGIEQPIVGEHPIISIAPAYRIICILNIA